MRNIKITALLLAVLMVVSAFAGCGSSNLDEQVSANADAIAGIEQSIKDLADSIAKGEGSSELDDIKADVEANKQGMDEIKNILNDLANKLNGATGESEDVKTAINQAGATIDALKEEYKDNKAHYTTEAYAAIVAALGSAQAAISTCVTAEAVAAVVATMETELAKCVRVDDSIYAYYVALKGNITDESAELAEEAEDALAAAVKFYKKADLKVNPLEEYEISEDETLRLAEELTGLIELQTGTGDGTLAQLKKKAAQLVKDIDEAAEELDEGKLEDLYDEYRDFVRDAKKLSEKNVALVTNADKLTAALASAENISAAIVALDKKAWEIKSLRFDTFDEYIQVFADYNALVDEDAQAVFTFASKKSVKDTKANMALTIKVYDAIDAKLAELAEDYELTDAAVAFVVDAYAKVEGWGEEYYARYEADKALVKAFEAEYKKLSDGVFADIKELASAKLTASSALELVEKYTANRDAINAWAAELVEAYKASYKALKDKDTVNFTADEYPALVEANFNAMAVAAELGDWEYVEETDDKDAYWDYKGYEGGLDDSENNFYYDLYAFDYAADNDDHDEGVLGKFLRVEFVAANTLANEINKEIKNFKVDQANSIVKLLVETGGYYANDIVTDEDGKRTLSPIEITDANKNAPYAATTIANFLFKYKTDNYDLSGMIDVDLYNEKLAAVEKAVADAEAALAELVVAYKNLLGENNNVVVTMENADTIIGLEALLKKAMAAANISVEKAIVDDTVDGLNVYELKYIVDAYLEEPDEAARKAFYNKFLLSTDYTDTVAGSKDTGAIIRLVYQAKALKKEASYVESAYKMIKKLNDATSGKAFAYATLKDGATVVNNLQASLDKVQPTDVAHLYGVLSTTYNEKKTSTGSTEYQAVVKVISFNAENGFYEATVSGAYKADKTTALRNALTSVQNRFLLVEAIELGDDADANAVEFYNAIFVDLVDAIKATDSEALYAEGELLAQKTVGEKKYDAVIPAFALPMIATYLEAKFIINNMGESTEAIDAAKATWGDTETDYGFEYNKAMVANMLRVGAKLTSNELDVIGSAINYSYLTRAITNINDARETGKIDFDIAFGHADAEWISETYDIRWVDYYTGNAVAADAGASTYADHGIDLDNLEIDVISIWDNEELELV